MKFWFTKKSPKDMYDGKAPYDATVEQVLRVAQEVSATPAEADREIFDFAKAFRTKAEPALPASIPSYDSSAFDTPATAQPRVSRATREEMERRLASYRAFQKKLNDEREARIRRTMDDVRAKLKQSAEQNPPVR